MLTFALKHTFLLDWLFCPILRDGLVKTFGAYACECVCVLSISIDTAKLPFADLLCVPPVPLYAFFVSASDWLV